MHTIEAALCTSLTLLLVGLLIIGGPKVYAHARDTAVADAMGSYARLDHDNMYSIDPIRIGACSMSAVSTSPDSLRDLIGVAAEAWTVISGWVDDILPRDDGGLPSDKAAGQEN